MKLRFFGFGVLYGLWVFLNLVFGFRFLSTLITVFRIFLSNADTIFLVSPRKLHPALVLKRELQGPLILRMQDKPSGFSSRYLGRNGCQDDYGKLKIALKQKTISQMSRGWDNVLWTLALECGPSSFYSSNASSLSSFRRANNIALIPLRSQQRRDCLVVKM